MTDGNMIPMIVTGVDVIEAEMETEAIHGDIEVQKLERDLQEIGVTMIHRSILEIIEGGHIHVNETVKAGDKDQEVHHVKDNVKENEESVIVNGGLKVCRHLKMNI